MTANEIQNLADGIPITRLEGVLKETYKPKNGTTPKGDWQVQDAVLQLPDGEVKLKAWNCGDLKNLKGQRIAVEAHKSDRHGWVGIKKVVEEYPKGSGKIYHKVEINEQCKIAQANGATPQPQLEARPQQSPATTVEYDEDASIQRAIDFATKAANGLLIALRETHRAADAFEKEYLGTEVPQTQRQAMTSSIFIGLHKEGLVNALPAKPIKSLARESALPEKVVKAADVRDQGLHGGVGDDKEIPW